MEKRMDAQAEQKNGDMYRHGLLTWMPLMVIFAGCILRLRQYIYCRSLWLDEAALTLGIIRQPWDRLQGHLDTDQYAPIGFIILEKLSLSVFGINEYALRLFPFLCGVFALGIFYLLTRRFLNVFAATIAMIFFAFSEHLIYYSTEMKQYSSDVAITLVLFLMFAEVHKKKINVWIALLFMFCGVGAVFTSFPAIFVLAGGGMTYLAVHIYRREHKETFIWAAIAGVWFAAFLVYFFVLLKQDSKVPLIQNFWSHAFMPFPPKSLRDLTWGIDAMKRMFVEPVGLTFSGLAILAFTIGVVSLFKKSRFKLSILMSPIFVTLCASALHKYPFGGRLILFLAGPIILIMAEGIVDIGRREYKGIRLVSILLCLLLLIHPLHVAASQLIHPKQVEETVPVFEYIENNHNEGDILYLYFYVDWRYIVYVDHMKRFNFEDMEVIHGEKPEGQWANLLEHHWELMEGKRVWIILSAIISSEEQYTVHLLDQLGTRLDTFRESRASGYLYDFSTKESSVEINK